MENIDSNSVLTTYLIQKINTSRHNIHTMKVNKKKVKEKYRECKRRKGRFDEDCKRIKIRIISIDEDINKEIMYRKKILHKLRKNMPKYKKIYYQTKVLIKRAL